MAMLSPITISADVQQLHEQIWQFHERVDRLQRMSATASTILERASNGGMLPTNIEAQLRATSTHTGKKGYRKILKLKAFNAHDVLGMETTYTTSAPPPTVSRRSVDTFLQYMSAEEVDDWNRAFSTKEEGGVNSTSEQDNATRLLHHNPLDDEEESLTDTESEQAGSHEVSDESTCAEEDSRVKATERELFETFSRAVVSPIVAAEVGRAVADRAISFNDYGGGVVAHEAAAIREGRQPPHVVGTLRDRTTAHNMKDDDAVLHIQECQRGEVPAYFLSTYRPCAFDAPISPSEVRRRRFFRRMAYNLILSNRVTAEQNANTARAHEVYTRRIYGTCRTIIHELREGMLRGDQLTRALRDVEREVLGEYLMDPGTSLRIPRLQLLCANPSCAVAFSVSLAQVMCRRCGQFFCPRCTCQWAIGPDVHVLNAAHNYERRSLGWETVCAKCWDVCLEEEQRVRDKLKDAIARYTEHDATGSVENDNHTNDCTVGIVNDNPIASRRVKELAGMSFSTGLRLAMVEGIFCATPENPRLSDNYAPFYVGAAERSLSRMAATLSHLLPCMSQRGAELLRFLHGNKHRPPAIMS